MENRLVLFDKAEVILFVPTKNSYNNYHFLNSDFSRIQFDKCTEYKFGIIPQESEKITLVTSKLSEYIVYTKGKCKKYFDEYKEGFEKYAKDYRITFTDNTKSE